VEEQSIPTWYGEHFQDALESLDVPGLESLHRQLSNKMELHLEELADNSHPERRWKKYILELPPGWKVTTGKLNPPDCNGVLEGKADIAAFTIPSGQYELEEDQEVSYSTVTYFVEKDIRVIQRQTEPEKNTTQLNSLFKRKCRVLNGGTH
jgi:hypothetical protein